MKPSGTQFQALISGLVDTLREELRHNRRLRDILREKKAVRLRNAPHDAEAILRREREVVTDLATIERDRIALLTEVGQLLEHPAPSRLRIAELVHHAFPEDRDELLDLRDEFRDMADEIDDMSSVEPIFTRHRQDHVRLYVSPGRWKGLLPEKRESPRPGAGRPAVPRRDGA
jgi:hypothetical protein